jgi:beta-glucosidase
MEGRTYKFIKEDPLYPFGFGLSYTTFSYTDLRLDNENIKPGEDVNAAVTVTNTGSKAGETVLQLYLRDEEASVRVPRHKLCGIRRVSLEPGESTVVRLKVDAQHLCIIDETGEFCYEPGKFTLYAGGSQPDSYSVKLAGSSCASTSFNLQVLG